MQYIEESRLIMQQQDIEYTESLRIDQEKEKRARESAVIIRILGIHLSMLVPLLRTVKVYVHH